MPTQRYLRILSERTSRRGMIARAGKMTLAAVGVATVTQSLRVFTPKAALGDGYYCSDEARYAGLCGTPCAYCSPAGTDSSCPSGTSVISSSSWYACLCNQNCGGQCCEWYYSDCCSTDSTRGGPGGCNGPSGECTSNCPQQTWCNGTEYYVCSIITFYSTC